MSNLTGEYDVLVEVGVNALNGILGAVHENQDPHYPTMPHSLALVVNDSPRGAGDPVPASSRTGFASRVEVQVSTPIVFLPVDTLDVRPDVLGGAHVMGTRAETPPSPGPEAPAGRDRPRVQGRAIESGSIDLGESRTRTGIIVPPTGFGRPRITAKVRVRAWVRDPTTPPLPSFLHGDLFVSTALVRSEVPNVGTFLTIDRTFGPQVTFLPAPGVAVTDDQRRLIETVIRNVIQGDMEPPTFRVSLPPEVKHFDFKLEPEARRPAVLLLLTLTDRTPGPGAQATVRAGLLPDGADFAIGVGRDFIVNLLRTNLFQGVASSFSFSKLGVSGTVRPDFAGASFNLEPGRIVFSLTGDGDISWFGIDDHFTFSMRLAFGLQVVGGDLTLVADGDPVISLVDVAVGGDFIEGKARDRIKEERDAALAAGGAGIQDALDVRGQIETILAGINPRPADVSLTGVEIRPDGVAAFGTIGLAASGPVAVSHATRGGFHDALRTWIPGGTIDRLVWQLPRHIPPGTVVRVDDHRFVTEPVGLGLFGSICLTVEGTRVTAGGGIAPVTAAACLPLAPSVVQLDGLPAASDRPLLPLTEATADGGIRSAGHYDPWGRGHRPPGGHANLVVHFATEGGPETATLLREALGAVRNREAAILAVGVVPAGGVLRAGGGQEPEPVLLAEDPDGLWASVLGVAGSPATVLVGPQGDVLWRSDSEITAKKLAAALNKFARPGGEIVAQPIRVSPRLGERPPDVGFRLGDGAELSLRRLRGRPLALTFWTSRSEPSLDQLEFLREFHARAGHSAPLTIAVGSGETPERVGELAREQEFPFVMLPDPDQRITRAFGVWCWPSTVWIRADQRVEAIDIGAAATRDAPPPPYEHRGSAGRPESGA